MSKTLLQSLMTAHKQQTAGAPGDGYSWHRTPDNAIKNLTEAGKARRDEWLNEVRSIHDTGVSWRQALRQASDNRKKTNNNYLTVKTRVINSYKGRQADNVKCTGVVCPGKYNKPAPKTFRPQGHANKRVLTQAAAMALLKNYYRSRGKLSSTLIESERALKKDIATKRMHALNPCPVKIITLKNGQKRRIADKNPACADNWLYRTSKKYDMTGVDHGHVKVKVKKI